MIADATPKNAKHAIEANKSTTCQVIIEPYGHEPGRLGVAAEGTAGPALATTWAARPLRPRSTPYWMWCPVGVEQLGPGGGRRIRHVGTGSWNDDPVAEKPEKPFMTKGAERVLVWSFLIPIILLAGTFIVLAIAR